MNGQRNTKNGKLDIGIPNSWSQGSVVGLCARNGIEVAMTWKDHRITTALFYAMRDTVLKVLIGDEVIEKVMKYNEIFRIE